MQRSFSWDLIEKIAQAFKPNIIYHFYTGLSINNHFVINALRTMQENEGTIGVYIFNDFCGFRAVLTKDGGRIEGDM